MTRRLFDFVVAVSLLSCVLVCVLWVRSYRLSDGVRWSCAGGFRWIQSAEGHVFVGLLLSNWSGRPDLFQHPKYVRDSAFTPMNDLIFGSLDRGDIDVSREYGGFAWYERRKARRGIVHARHLRVVAPFWSLAVATVILPLGWTIIRSRARPRGEECHTSVPESGGP